MGSLSDEDVPDISGAQGPHCLPADSGSRSSWRHQVHVALPAPQSACTSNLGLFKKLHGLEEFHLVTPKMRAHHPSRVFTSESWLQMNDSGVLCKVCPDYQVTWLHLHKGKLLKHGSSKGHLTNVAKHLGVGEMLDVPSASVFKEFWDAVMKGVAPSSVGGQCGTHHRCGRLLACLAEGCRSSHRHFISTAGQKSQMALSRDDRSNKQCIRFRCVNESLEIRNGLLGWRSFELSDAVSKTKGTIEAITQFCTPRFSAGVPDATVAAAIRSARYLCTDSAAPELLSGVMMKHGIDQDDRDACTPEILHVRDKSHSTLRVLKRPFAADAYLQGIVDAFVLGNSSNDQREDTKKDTLVSVVHYSK